MSYLKSYNLLTKILIVFIVASCGGGKAPFALTLPDISNLTLDEDNELVTTFNAKTNYLSEIEYSLTTNSINGNSTISLDGVYSYLPDLNFFGNDSFTIQVTAYRLDNGIRTTSVISKTMKVDLTINPVNDPPELNILDDLSNYTKTSMVFDETISINATISDVDNAIDQISYFGQLNGETISGYGDVASDAVSITLNVDEISVAGLNVLSICANDGVDSTCRGNIETYFIHDKQIKLIDYDCDEDGNNCSQSNHYLYYIYGNVNSDAKTDYVFIGDQLNGYDGVGSVQDFRLRLLESINNLMDSDAGNLFSDYFNVLVLEEVDATGLSLFDIDTGCYSSWDSRIYCIGDVDRTKIGDIVGDWDTVSFLTTLSGRGVAQGSVNIQPISSRSAEIVQHELGHSHGFMGDEYDSRGERSFPSWYAEFSVNTTAVSDPSIVKWNHFIEDMTSVPGVDYDVCYNYPDGSIYYRDGLEYEDCECYMNTYDENHPEYNSNYPGINEDDSCKDRIGLFQGTYYDEVDTYRPKWISVMWCCYLDYGKINVEGFAIGSITNQFNGFNDFIIKSDISDDVDLDNTESLGEYITFDVNGVFDTDKLKLSWYVNGIEQIDLENQLVATFNRPDDNSMVTYSWQVEDLTGNLIAPNDPLNPRDLYEGIFNMWSYYDPDPNTNPNINPNYPYVGTWYWHRINGIKDTDDTVDKTNMDDYLYAEQCCALGYGYKINWINYEPVSVNTVAKSEKEINYFDIKLEVGNIEKILTLNVSSNSVNIGNIKISEVKKEHIKNNRINFKDKYMITFHDKDMNPIYNLGLGDPFNARIQHIGFEDEGIFNIDIPLKNFKIAYPRDLNPYFITYSKRVKNNTFEAIEVIKL
tara:strand:- start:279 stop:2882 length:2604 start_codon:yes stop_codon:yes gene_type:complete